MQKVFLSLLLSTIMFSCSAKNTENILKNGYYLEKIRDAIIFEYYVLIEVRDSTAIITAFCHEKGIKTGYDMFAGIPKSYVSFLEHLKFPSSESFQVSKNDQNYIFYNSEHEVVASFDKGKLKISTPFEITLKYYEVDPVNLYPAKIDILRGCLFRNPYMFFESEEKPDESCMSYIKRRLYDDYDEIRNNSNISQMNYDEFYEFIKMKVSQYKKECPCSP